MLLGSGPTCSTRVSSAWVSSLTRCASESRPARAGALSDVIDAGAERLHVAGDRRDAFGRRDAGGELAQLVDRGLEIAQRLRIGRAAPRRCPSCATARRCARRSPPGLRPASSALSAACTCARRCSIACSCRRVGAAAIAALDPLGERVHVALQAFQRAARQRVADGARDRRRGRRAAPRPSPRRRTAGAAPRSAA